MAIAQVVPGLTLDQARECRDLWESLGWWEDIGTPGASEWKQAASTLFEQAGLPYFSEDPEEYWVLSARPSTRDWHLGGVWINDLVPGADHNARPSPHLVITRCRLIILDLTNRQLRHWPHFDIASTEVNKRDAVIRYRKSGDIVRFSANTKGPRLIDTARYQYWSFTDNTAERYLAGNVVGRANAERSEFMAIVDEFVKTLATISQNAGAQGFAPPVTKALSSISFDSRRTLQNMSQDEAEDVTLTWRYSCPQCSFAISSFYIECPSCNYMFNGQEQVALGELLSYGVNCSDTTEWEYTDTDVPLNFKSKEEAANIAKRANNLIREHLNRSIAEGWSPAESVDFKHLLRLKRVRFQSNLFTYGGTYYSAQIRLRRPVKI